MKRSEIAEKDKWNLTDLYADVAEFEREFSFVNKNIPTLIKYKGRLYDADAFCECMKLVDDFNLKLTKLQSYAMLYKDEDTTLTQANALYGRMMSLVTAYSSVSSFIMPELNALDDATLDSFISNEKLKDYDYMLKTLKRDKKYILSAGEEKILALAGEALSGYRNVFSMINDADMPFPKVEYMGTREKLTHGKYSLMLSSPNQAVRKRAFTAMYKAVSSLINTIATNYSSSVIKDNFLATARGYNSALERSTISDDVPSEIYHKLISEVGKNVKSVHEYVALRRKALKLEKMHMYDLYVPIVNEQELKYSYEQAFDTVIEGLAPLGEEYISVLRRARDDRWIDVYETENKHSGAYSLDVYGVHPYVLLNHTGTTHDVFTIAHELGHAMHSYYSNETQPISKADYSIFVAEVASTVNEVLLLKSLIKKATDVQQKKYLLSYYLDTFRTTLFRQTMFAEFELFAHSSHQSGKALTVESLSKEYLRLNKKYYGPAVTHDREIRFEWARIPHFYRQYYVYKYSTGLISAVNIARDILTYGDEFVKKYKNAFLCAGGSKSPYEILCDVGVDLKTDEPYIDAFNEFNDVLEQLKSLI